MGISASYQDITSKKVRNKLLVIVMLAFVALAMVGVINFGPWKLSDIIINALIGSFFSILLWRSGIWPAGDAKLFILVTIVVPFSYYTNHFMPYFPSFAILINSFFIAFTLLSLMVLLDAVRYGWRVATGKIPLEQLLSGITKLKSELPVFIKSTFLLVGIFIPARIIGDYFTAMQGGLFSKFVMIQFLVAFILYRQIQTYLSRHVSLIVCVSLAFIGIIVKFIITGYNSAEVLNYIGFVFKLTLIFMVGLNALVKLFDAYIKAMQTTEQPAAMMDEGLLIDREFWTNYLKEHQDVEISKTLRPEGLEKEQARILMESLGGDARIPVVRTFPFAPIIFCGVLLTMLIKQSALHLIITYFRMGAG